MRGLPVTMEYVATALGRREGKSAPAERGGYRGMRPDRAGRLQRGWKDVATALGRREGKSAPAERGGYSAGGKM